MYFSLIHLENTCHTPDKHNSCCWTEKPNKVSQNQSPKQFDQWCQGTDSYDLKHVLNKRLDMLQNTHIQVHYKPPPLLSSLSLFLVVFTYSLSSSSALLTLSAMAAIFMGVWLYLPRISGRSCTRHVRIVELNK